MALVLALAALGVPGTAFAGRDAKPPRRFVQLRDEGYRLYAADAYERAAEQFAAAYEADPRQHQMLFNLGKCMEKLGRYAAALEHLEGFVARLPDHQRVGDARATAHYLQDKLAATHSQLRITTTPPGASVTLGHGDGVGRTPWTRWTALGEHHVRVSLSGYLPAERNIEIEKGKDATLDLILIPVDAPGVVALVGAPGGATVHTGGRAFRVDGPFELAPGSHALRVELAGHRPFETTVEIAPGAQVGVPVTFEALHPSPLDVSPSARELEHTHDRDGGPIPTSTWVVGGVGAAALATGVGLLALASQRFDDARQYSVQPTANDATWLDMKGRAEDTLLAGSITTAVGGAAILTAAGLALWGRADSEATPAIGAAMTPGGGAASVCWSF